MSKTLPYFKWYPADAEGDDFYASLTDAEGWTFTRCLNRSWMNNGIPANLDELAAVLHRSRAYINRVWPKVGQVWIASPDDSQKLINPRQERERDAANHKSSNMRREKNSNAKGSRINEPKTQLRSNCVATASYARMTMMSVSDFKEKGVQGEKESAPPCQSEYPRTLAVIREHDPAVDEFFVLRLVQETIQKLISNSRFPQDRIEAATTDRVISRACSESFATGPANHRTGLLLHRVPGIIVTWGVQKEAASA